MSHTTLRVTTHIISSRCIIRFWITPNTLANRYAFIRSVISNAEPGMFKVNVFDFVKNNIPNGTAADARLLVMELARYLLPVTDNLTFDDAAG